MEINPAFETAVDFINNTSSPIFLTGKAGTGKTTFLKYIKENTKKKSIVVAPTGVAAINARGVTMHSFFQLPLGPFVPSNVRSTSDNVTDRFKLFRDIRLSSEKRDLIRDLQLLIIDEVSMVRCDTLDAMDAILRHFRKKPHLVFGGVQVLFIGDLFQLPPVMPDGEWSILKDYYQSPFFFHSKAVQQSSLVYIELKKIYRQNEQRFIEILNRVRNNEANSDDLKILNDRFGKELQSDKKYITLTSHNYKADKINNEELKKLPGKSYEFKGSIEGDFPEKALPTDINMQLKEGAQVMFIRNDKSEDRRYFNGKLATITRIDKEGIRVAMDDGGEELQLEKETWENIKYSYNSVENKVDEEKLGSFSQYPIRLAWAITIHKSQGLTFEHAIIDAGESFAPGQVYVALSRCVSLDGLILHSRIDSRSISTHEAVLAFASSEKDDSDLQRILSEEKNVYRNANLVNTFDLADLADLFEDHTERMKGKTFDHLSTAISFGKTITRHVETLQDVSIRFKPELERLLKGGDVSKIKDRASSAIKYFSNQMLAWLPLFDAQIEDVKKVKKVKKYLKHLKDLKLAVVKRIESIETCQFGDVPINDQPPKASVEKEREALSRIKDKSVKGDSVKDTLALFQAGRSQSQIAEERGLALSTVESHLATLIRMGEVDVKEVVPAEKLKVIIEALHSSKSSSVSNIKSKLGDEYSFGEIRAVWKHLEMLSSRKRKPSVDEAKVGED